MTTHDRTPDRRFYEAASLNVSTYDLRHPVTMDDTPVAGDVEFYRSLATQLSGPVLEMAAGTGRVAFALADAGFDVVGVDRSEPMLAVAREKLHGAPQELAQHLEFIYGDMESFDLGRTFGLAIIAGRSFQSLLTDDLQRACLQTAFRHLRPGGVLAMDLFDPLLDQCIPEQPFDGPVHRAHVRLPGGHAVDASVISHDNDPIAQVMRETWRFIETDAPGKEVRVEDEELSLRWSYRYEIRHLLELSGFTFEAEYSDFRGSPPAYGKELILVARRPAVLDKS